MLAMQQSINQYQLQKMIQHWLSCPVGTYVGSNYGSDAKALLQKPSSGPVANDYIQKLKSDIPILTSMPSGSINLYSMSRFPDGVAIYLEVAGQEFEVSA